MTILTAGYGNRGFEKFIDLMRAHGVTHLVDVRSVPTSSYWEDFRRERLERIVPPTGIRYVYMGDTLGGAKPAPDAQAVDLSPITDTTALETGLRQLIKAASAPDRILCLMCGCLRPHKCHRSRLLGEALVARGVDVLHLDENGEAVAHAVVVSQAAAPQPSLF